MRTMIKMTTIVPTPINMEWLLLIARPAGRGFLTGYPDFVLRASGWSGFAGDVFETVPERAVVLERDA
jgi:hypothetical protein